ncbi:BMP family lipoprotein [Anaerobranca gottschalkii]|uniref:Nucleoside-binding protein n=1 Tax=Anaerobranca gottschalkii DSM 13577 TaxID=1120990 RepID=A0A1H9Z823_9FIRM|nr:BMP family ABC transporter substrate-binding protein [Anaerobranca gottschalkii]SES77746.1 nucleoside-binding protein [Anaerobranca gottschalkii DSM 13577]
MKKNLIILLVSLMILSVALTGCGGGKANEGEEKLRIAIVYSTGGLGDKSFNDSAHRGLLRAEKELGVEIDWVEPRDSAEDADYLRGYAAEGFDLVIAVGFQMADSLKTVAQEYPDINFAIIDSVVELPNVASLVFAEHEGSFLAGALAALVTESNIIGFIGGIQFPLIERFEGGFIAGAKHINPDIQVLSQYARSFGDPATGKEIALAQIDAGADVIYHASGGTGGGLFEAAMERGIYAIGVDSNQNFLAPGYGIASMLKRVDVAVFETIRALTEGEFKGGQSVMFDLAIDGVGLTDLVNIDIDEQAAKDSGDITEAQLNAIKEMKQRVTAQHADKINEIRAGIINGTIKVPDWMTEGRPE